MRHQLLQTQAPQTPLPTLQMIRSTEAVMVAPPPGAVLVENLPATPPPFAADPNDQGQNQNQMLRVLRLTQPASRALPSRRFGPNEAMSALNVTGINHWWTYEEDAIGGVGRYMVNIGTGNLIVQADDMAIPHKGIELAFRRTYNSYSQHDYNNTDGSVVDNYGDGWTNTFDAHIAQNTLNDPHCGRTGISVYDIDGARYDYAIAYNSQTQSCYYQPPTGQFASLQYDVSTGWYWWTKTSGTVYMFHNPTDPNAGIAGRLSKIWARNNNCQLKFTYTFDTGATPAPATLNQITVQTESTNSISLKATLSFNNSNTRRLLHTLTWPDGTVITYKYNSSGQLVEVDEPANTTLGGSIPQTYSYSSTGYLLASAAGGRWSSSNGTDGQIISFDYSGSSVTDVRYNGWINPTVPQPSSAPGPVQPSVDSNYGTLQDLPYRYVTFASSATGVVASPAPQPAPSASPCAGTTAWYDSDGHETFYCWDASNRVVQTDDWTGSLWLVTAQTWDGSDDLTETTDARGNKTDYAYDAIGDATMVAQPTVNGIRPTATYAYDTNFNVVAYCDPVFNDAHNFDYGGGTIPACPTSWANSKTNPGPAQFAYQNPAYEPYGELTRITKPMGYNVSIGYPTTGTDYGLPVQSAGDLINQDDGSSATPTQTFAYDSFGNLICYSKSIVGPTPSPAPSSPASVATWALAYDHDGTNQSLGRVVEIADPDDGSSLSVNKCAKPANSTTTVSYKYYYPNGQVEETETPAQHQIDLASPSPGVQFPQGGVSYQYDSDGNETLEVHNHGFAQGQTQKWYDAAEHLVQVQLPYESRSFINIEGSPYRDACYLSTGDDCYAFPWMTRYLYDLAHGGTVSVGAITGVHAYGNLFKTQEFLAGGWTDLKGNGYDAMDRAVAKYADAPGNTGLQTWLSVYDGNTATNGLLTSTKDPLLEVATFTYDSLGREYKVTYSGDGGVTPGETYGYDPDGRTTSVTSTTMGEQQYTYDADGDMTSSIEPSAMKSAATLTYGYYGNGWRESIGVASSALTQNAPPLMEYAYRSDGLQAWEKVNHGPSPVPIFTDGYSPAGRLISQSDPSGGKALAYDASGREASLALTAPGVTTTVNSYGYDAEGATTTKAVVGGGVFTNLYNVRGELVQSDWPGSGPVGLPKLSANGYLWPVNQAVCGQGCGAEADKVGLDPLSGIALADKVHCYLETCPPGMTWTFDSAGRQTSESVPIKAGKYTLAAVLSKSYDAANHQISQHSDNPSYPLTCEDVADVRSYTWGPNGRLQEIKSTTTTVWSGKEQTADRTLHWDGGQLLFTTNGNGDLDDLKVDAKADFTPQDPSFTGLTMWDRDLDGVAFYGHNINGQHLVVSGGAFAIQHCSSPSTPGFPSSFGWLWSSDMSTSDAGLIAQPRMDGILDGINTFQGVRVYDDASASWTTPDAYPGNVDDPMSQKTYMWNKDDPVRYSDPTGFYTFTSNSEDTEWWAGVIAGYRATVQDELNSYQASCGTHCDQDYVTRMNNLISDLTPGTPGLRIDTNSTDASSASDSQYGSTDSSTGEIWLSNANIGRLGRLGNVSQSGILNSAKATLATLVEETSLSELVRGRAGKDAEASFKWAEERDRNVSSQWDYNEDMTVYKYFAKPIVHFSVDDDCSLPQCND